MWCLENSLILRPIKELMNMAKNGKVLENKIDSDEKTKKKKSDNEIDEIVKLR